MVAGGVYSESTVLVLWDGGTQFPTGGVDLVTFPVAVAILPCVAGNESLVTGWGSNGGAVVMHATF